MGHALLRSPLMVDSTTLLADPEWLAHRFVESEDAFRFIRVERDVHTQVPFLTDDYLGQRPSGGDVQADACLNLPDEGNLHFLFHSAFCGSTLLTHALSQQGLAAGLSEPVVLNDIVGFRLRGAQPRDVARAADLATRLLGRRFGPGEAVIVKPSNILNPLAALLMALRPHAKAVFLYAPLETFLISVARKGLACRLWVRQLLESYMREGVTAGMGFERDDFFRQTDLQIAAIGWLIQHRIFTTLAGKLGHDRLASLNSDIMLTNPAEALTAAAHHYGMALSSGQVSELVSGPAFSHHSKSGEAYSSEQRTADYARTREAYGDEISMVLTWTAEVARAAGIALDQPNPLTLQA